MIGKLNMIGLLILNIFGVRDNFVIVCVFVCFENISNVIISISVLFDLFIYIYVLKELCIYLNGNLVFFCVVLMFCSCVVF